MIAAGVTKMQIEAPFPALGEPICPVSICTDGTRTKLKDSSSRRNRALASPEQQRTNVGVNHAWNLSDPAIDPRAYRRRTRMAVQQTVGLLPKRGNWTHPRGCCRPAFSRLDVSPAPASALPHIFLHRFFDPPPHQLVPRPHWLPTQCSPCRRAIEDRPLRAAFPVAI
jgi:hypothetical protein